MSYWEGPTRWVNTLLLVIVGFIGFDTLFRMLEANEANVIVDFVRDVAAYFLGPFVGMFAEEESMLTALVAVLGYSLAAGILLAVFRAIQASRPSNIRRTRYVEDDRELSREGVRGDRSEHAQAERQSGAIAAPRGEPYPSEAERTRRLGPPVDRSDADVDRQDGRERPVRERPLHADWAPRDEPRDEPRDVSRQAQEHDRTQQL